MRNYLSVWALYDNNWENLTDMVKTVQTSMTKEEVSRKFDVTIGYPVLDKRQPRFQVAPGTLISVNLNYDEIFRGWAQEREINTESGELTFTAQDCIIYLLRSKVTYNFKDIESEYAVEQIAKDLGIPYNIVPTTGIKISRKIDGKTAYEAIMEIYTQVSKQNGKFYMPYADHNMLSIMEKGTIIKNNTWYGYASETLTPDRNLIGLTYKDSMTSMVNRVKIYDDKGTYVGVTELPDMSKAYGVFQEEYHKEDGKEPYTEAKKLFHSIDREFTVNTVGDWRYRTGYAILSQIPYVDLLTNKIMYIDGDTHIWDLAKGKYTTELKVSYDNTMDWKED